MKPMVLIKTSDLPQDDLFHESFLWFRYLLSQGASTTDDKAFSCVRVLSHVVWSPKNHSMD
jgi:hypothetical protein